MSYPARNTTIFVLGFIPNFKHVLPFTPFKRIDIEGSENTLPAVSIYISNWLTHSGFLNSKKQVNILGSSYPLLQRTLGLDTLSYFMDNRFSAHFDRKFNDKHRLPSPIT